MYLQSIVRFRALAILFIVAGHIYPLAAVSREGFLNEALRNLVTGAQLFLSSLAATCSTMFFIMDLISQSSYQQKSDSYLCLTYRFRFSIYHGRRQPTR